MDAPTIVEFSVAPESVEAGATVTLAWLIKGYFDAISIDGFDGDAPKDARGSVTTQVAATKKFTLVVDSSRSEPKMVVVAADKSAEPPTEADPAATVAITSFTGALAVDDGAPHDPQSLQVELGKQITLSWTTTGADSVELEPGGSFPAQGRATLAPTADTVYSLVAKSKSGAASAAAEVRVGTHSPEECVSPHATAEGAPPVEQASAPTEVAGFTAVPFSVKWVDKPPLKVQTGTPVHLKWQLINGTPDLKLVIQQDGEKGGENDVAATADADGFITADLQLTPDKYTLEILITNAAGQRAIAGATVVTVSDDDPNEVNQSPGGQTPYKTTAFRKTPVMPLDKVVKSANIQVAGQDFVDWFNNVYQPAFKTGGYVTDGVIFIADKNRPDNKSTLAQHKLAGDRFKDYVNAICAQAGGPISLSFAVGIAMITYNETGGRYLPIAETATFGNAPFDLAKDLNLTFKYNCRKDLGNRRAGDQLKTERNVTLTDAQLEAWNKGPGSATCPDRGHDGDAQECDFYKFRGRGFNQLTGRNGYATFCQPFLGGQTIDQLTQQQLTDRFLDLKSGLALNVLLKFNKGILHFLEDPVDGEVFPDFAGFGRRTGGSDEYGNFYADRCRRLIVEMLRAGCAFA